MKQFTTTEGKLSFLFNKMALDTFWRPHNRWGSVLTTFIFIHKREWSHFRLLFSIFTDAHTTLCLHPSPQKGYCGQFLFGNRGWKSFDACKTQVKLETKDTQNFSRWLNKVNETVNRLLWIVFRVNHWLVMVGFYDLESRVNWLVFINTQFRVVTILICKQTESRWTCQQAVHHGVAVWAVPWDHFYDHLFSIF